jgi:hypothetical protein
MNPSHRLQNEPRPAGPGDASASEYGLFLVNARDHAQAE